MLSVCLGRRVLIISFKIIHRKASNFKSNQIPEDYDLKGAERQTM